MAASTRRDSDQPIRPPLKRLLGVRHVGDVVQHDAPVRVDGVVHVLPRSQRGDHHGHLVRDRVRVRMSVRDRVRRRLRLRLRLRLRRGLRDRVRVRVRVRVR